MIRPRRSGIRCSNRSAARSRQAARDSTLVAAQSGQASCAAFTAGPASRSRAKATVPTRSRRSAGLNTGWLRRSILRPVIFGLAFHSPRADSIRRGVNAANTASLARSIPAELHRSTNISRGRVISGCGAPSGSIVRASSTGSCAISSSETASSQMRWTNEEFAPFSSNRRTR